MRRETRQEHAIKAKVISIVKDLETGKKVKKPIKDVLADLTKDVSEFSKFAEEELKLSYEMERDGVVIVEREVGKEKGIALTVHSLQEGMELPPATAQKLEQHRVQIHTHAASKGAEVRTTVVRAGGGHEILLQWRSDARYERVILRDARHLRGDEGKYEQSEVRLQKGKESHKIEEIDKALEAMLQIIDDEENLAMEIEIEELTVLARLDTDIEELVKEFEKLLGKLRGKAADDIIREFQGLHGKVQAVLGHYRRWLDAIRGIIEHQTRAQGG
jgi:hypothetical protein